MVFKLNKKGLGLPTVLGIVAFVLAIGSTLLTYAVAQSNLVKQSFDRTEAYANAVQAVDATTKIIARDQNLDPAYLSALEAYMGVTIESYSASVYTISSMVTSTKLVQSYLTGSSTTSSSTDLIFENTGQESDFELSPLVTPGNLLGTFLPDYMEANFSWLTPQTGLNDISSIVSYVRSLALSSSGFEYHVPNDLESQWNPTAWWHWYVDGTVTIPNDKSLTIPNGRILVIDGNLTMNRGSTLSGNVIVNGTFTINTKNKYSQNLYGTVYAKGNVKIANDTNLGTVSRPSFVLTEKDVTLSNRITGYGYFLSRNLTSSKSTTIITGGVYTIGTLSLKKEVLPNYFLDTTKLFSFAIPLAIDVEDGGSGASTKFIFTSPQLN